VLHFVAAGPGKYQVHHILYKTTCLRSGKYYVGMHSTNDLDDNYLGSGKMLQRSIDKHGRDQHVRTVLATANTREDLISLEKLFVTEALVKDEMSLNLALGGQGGRVKLEYSAEDRARLAAMQTERWADPEFRKKTASGIARAWTNPEYRELRTAQSFAMWTPERKAQHSAATKNLKRTAESKARIAEAVRGTRWMSNGARCIKVLPDQIEAYTNMGFRPGRK
jgi:hypothetical protein